MTLDVAAATYLGGRAPNYLNALAIEPSGSIVGTGSIGESFQGVEDPYPLTSGTIEPSQLHPVYPSAATITRVTPNLDHTVDSTWIQGAARSFGSALGIHSEGRVHLGSGTNTQFDLPNLVSWSKVWPAWQSKTDGRF